MNERFQISQEQQIQFADLLNKVDVSHLDPHSYPDRYLQHLLIHRSYYIRIYAHVLNTALQASGRTPSAMRIVDYGAGNGLLGFFAAFCGFRNVVLVDADPSFTAAAEKLGMQISIPVDAIITGELAQLEQFLGSDKPDVIAGTDVIEHIYDLSSFFGMIHNWNPSAITIFTTASNSENPFKVKWLKKIQLKDEYEGGFPEDLLSSGEQLPFLDMRRMIIHDLGIAEAGDIEELARLTRGLRKDDIEAAVGRFKETGSYPPQPSHPTNTCNPITGNWTERILEIEDYRRIYESNGFRLNILDGFYNSDKKFPLSLLSHAANALIPLTGHRLSPFITLVGRRI